MENNSKDESISMKKGLKIGLKTLVACFVGIMFVNCFIFVLFPKMSLKINDTLGLNKVKELNYQMIYNRSSKITDLYNVILYEGEIGNYEKELSYIDEMISRKDYGEFCEEMDKVSYESTSDKNLIPYSVNVNGYLMARKVVCLYNLKIDGIDTYVYRQTSLGKFSEYSFSAYVDLIYNDDSLENAQKKEKLSLLMSMPDTSGETHEELIEARIENIKNALKIEEDKEKQISLQYTLTRIYRSRYYVFDVLGDETKKQENNDLFVYARLKLNEMIDL